MRSEQRSVWGMRSPARQTRPRWGVGGVHVRGEAAAWVAAVEGAAEVQLSALRAELQSAERQGGEAEAVTARVEAEAMPVAACVLAAEVAALEARGVKAEAARRAEVRAAEVREASAAERTRREVARVECAALAAAAEAVAGAAAEKADPTFGGNRAQAPKGPLLFLWPWVEYEVKMVRNEKNNRGHRPRGL